MTSKMWALIVSAFSLICHHSNVTWATSGYVKTAMIMLEASSLISRSSVAGRSVVRKGTRIASWMAVGFLEIYLRRLRRERSSKFLFSVD